MLTQGEVESLIAIAADRLEAETDRYAEVADAAAEAEAAWKNVLALTWVSMADSGVKHSVVERDRRAEAATAKEFREWKLLEARRMACREAMLSHRARLDALRTIAANIRSQT